MNRTELTELIRNRENSGVEFKRDDILPEKLAKEMAALLNLEGGHILLGVEDDGTVSGLSRDPEKAEEWAMEAIRVHLRPAAIPYWETLEWSKGKIVGIVSLPADAPDKPYKAKRGSAWVTQIRVGTTTRDATDEEEARLYQQSGRLQYDRKPVPGVVVRRPESATPGQLLPRRSAAKLSRRRRSGGLESSSDEHGVDGRDRGRPIPSAGGLLLFGTRPKKYLPQSGISASAYPGTEKDYAAKARTVIHGPAVSLFPTSDVAVGQIYPSVPRTFSEQGDATEAGVIEQALDFVRRNTTVSAQIEDGGRRQERWDYPLEAVREALVNAIAHRDYTIVVTDIELSIYADRVEVISPGRLPNTVTVDKMRAGYRASRNELIKEVLRDYRYIEATGLGVPRKIVEGMRAHNGTETDLIEEDDRFIVRLWKEKTED